MQLHRSIVVWFTLGIPQTEIRTSVSACRIVSSLKVDFPVRSLTGNSLKSNIAQEHCDRHLLATFLFFSSWVTSGKAILICAQL